MPEVGPRRSEASSVETTCGPSGSSLPPGPAGDGIAPTSAGQPAVPDGACLGVPPELANHPKFVILRELGRGGMGVVYQARHTFLDQLVAIKVMNTHSLGNPDAKSRFLREMQWVGQLKHKNIVRAHDAEQMGELLLLVMEYVEGITLDRLVAQQGILPVAYACDCIVRAALGLQYAHEKNMVHRDIKPGNVIVAAKEREVKLLDFGLARGPRELMTATNQTQTGAVMGTPAFMAPEQTKDASSTDIRGDIYSLGCTLYFLLAGYSPFQRDSVMETMLAQVREEPRPLPEVRPDVPGELWAVMAKMLAKKPEDRYQTPKEVEQALRPFITVGRPAVRPGGERPAVLADASTLPPGVRQARTWTASVPPPVRRVAAPAASEEPAVVVVASPDAGTSNIKNVRRKVPAEAPGGEVPARDEEASPFADLTDTGAAPKEVGRARETGKSSFVAWCKRPAVQAAAVGVSLVMLLLAAFIMSAATAEVGTIRIVYFPLGAAVMVDGRETKATVVKDTFTGRLTAEIRVTADEEHRIDIMERNGHTYRKRAKVAANGVGVVQVP
jgi:hypothetical protein